MYIYNSADWIYENMHKNHFEQFASIMEISFTRLLFCSIIKNVHCFLTNYCCPYNNKDCYGISEVLYLLKHNRYRKNLNNIFSRMYGELEKNNSDSRNIRCIILAKLQLEWLSLSSLNFDGGIGVDIGTLLLVEAHSHVSH